MGSIFGRNELREYGPWALVTGASSGIGASFAQELASRGFSLVLAARRKDRLDQLATELIANHKIDVRVVVVDLADAQAHTTLMDATADLDIGLVIANAGRSEKGNFLDSTEAELVAMLDLNCRATTLSCHAFARRLVERTKTGTRGGLVIVASTAAFQATPFTAVYAATKAYDLFFAEALYHELRPHKVDVVALCPGATDTEGPKRTGVDASKVPMGLMDPRLVAKAGLDGLGKKIVVIPGMHNQLSAFSTRFLPRRLVSKLAGRMIRKVTR